MAVVNVKYTNCALLHAAAVDIQAPYQKYAYGYGDKQPTRYKIKYGETSRQLAAWRRVYAVCWGNAASVYIEMYGERLYLDSGIEYFLTDGVVDERMALAK
jgi:hypothetical protein